MLRDPLAQLNAAPDADRAAVVPSAILFSRAVGAGERQAAGRRKQHHANYPYPRSRERHLTFDLIDLLEVIGDPAAESTWRCAVEDFVPGESTKYLPAAYQVAEHGISGALLWQIAANTRQVIDGTFRAFLPNQEKPWVSFRAVDSSWWEIAAPDEEALLPFRARFTAVEDGP